MLKWDYEKRSGFGEGITSDKDCMQASYQESIEVIVKIGNVLRLNLLQGTVQKRDKLCLDC